MVRRAPKRLGITVTVAAGAILAFAAIGGTGLAGSLAKPVKAQYGPGQDVNPGKVTLCHQQKVTIRVSTRALPAHEAHGDVVGTCAAAASAAKAKAKAQAAKAAATAKAAAKAAKAAAKSAVKAQSQAGAQSGQSNGQGTGQGNGQGKAKGKSKS